MAELQRRMPDGRMAKYIDSKFDTRRDDDPEDQVPVLVTVSLDGVLATRRVFLPLDQVLPSFSDQINHEDGQHRDG